MKSGKGKKRLNLKTAKADGIAKEPITFLTVNQKDDLKEVLSSNMNSFAKITVRPVEPVVQTVRLHPAHERMINENWIVKIEVLPGNSVVEINGQFYERQWLASLGKEGIKGGKAGAELQIMLKQLGWDEFFKAMNRKGSKDEQ